MEHILKRAVSRTNKRNVIRQLLLFARIKPIYQRRAHKYIKRVMKFGASSEDLPPPPSAAPTRPRRPPSPPPAPIPADDMFRKDSNVFMIEVPDEAKIGQLVLDRNGYSYHGRVRAFTESARENGLEL